MLRHWPSVIPAEAETLDRDQERSWWKEGRGSQDTSFPSQLCCHIPGALSKSVGLLSLCSLISNFGGLNLKGFL